MEVLSVIGLFLVIMLFITLCIRGVNGNPNEQTLNTDILKDEGPLELSPERARFALAYSLVEDRSFQFSLPVARFATPDLGYINGKYVSLFAPGAGIFVIPGYIIGKYFGASQVGTYAMISYTAIVNALLIRIIAIKLGASKLASSIAGLVFLFATPAFAYAVTLYQHHVTVFLMLLSLYILVKYSGKWPLLIIWILIGFSVSIDYPNFVLFIPIGIYSFGRIINLRKINESVKLNIRLSAALTLITLLFPILFFMWTNKASYGNPLQLAGTVKLVTDFDEKGNPQFDTQSKKDPTDPTYKKKSATSFFYTRNVLYGLYIHLISNERGMLFYTPIILLSLFGVYFLHKEHTHVTALLLGIVGANILLYSMWGDPWGGWAFGSRYLIPSYALLSIFLAFALTKLKRNAYFLLVFLVLTGFSLAVNSLGALTTNRIPPKVEAVALEQISGRREHYTFLRNWEFLQSNRSKSYFYQTYANKYLTAQQYYFIITGSLFFIISLQLLYLYIH